MSDAPRCGNCKWYFPDSELKDHWGIKMGSCRWRFDTPVYPCSIKVHRSLMGERGGRNCPCHSPKEPDK